MISRREFLGTSLAAGASLAVTPPLDFARRGPELVEGPELLRALQQSAGKLIQRAIPSSGELLPAISFSPREEADDATMKAILETFLSNGGKVVDVLHGGPVGEQEARTAANALGTQDKFFWTTPQQTAGPGGPGKPPAQIEPAAVKAALDAKLTNFKKIDLVMISAGADAKQIAVLQEMKKAGRIRYIGVHELLFPANAQNPPWPATSRLEALMRNEPIDFIGTDYHLGDRRLEEKLLPLAMDRKIGVMAYFTFDRGRLFKRAGSTPLPEWAAEFGANTWAQFFIKYVLSHPAVTVVRTGTINPAHMLENAQAGMGPLPNEAMRKRMAALVDAFPPTAPPGPPPEVKLAPEILDRYVGEYTSASGFTAIFRREGDKLIVKPGNNPEAALIGRSPTRLQDPRGPVFEFEVDAQGKVTGAFLDQETPKGLQRMRLTRK
jgi:aryl-alcohol dehydrogenase-like predicted oxidoreductase